jgi:hypothetical protein
VDVSVPARIRRDWFQSEAYVKNTICWPKGQLMVFFLLIEVIYQNKSTIFWPFGQIMVDLTLLKNNPNNGQLIP